MKKLLNVLLFFIAFTTPQLKAQNWALEDPSKGWNSSSLVSLYFHNSELQTEWAFSALSHYQLQGDEHVLDFGCGDGKISAWMSTLVSKGSVTGVDISKEMLAFATKRFPASTYNNLSFQISEGVNIDLSIFQQKFDVVTAFCVFHLVPQPSQVLQDIKSLLKPGGKLIVTSPMGGNPVFYQAVAAEMALRGWNIPSPTSDSVQMRDPEKMKALLKSSGYEIEFFEMVNTRTPFRSKEELVDWFEGTLSANWNLPPFGRRDFFVAVLNRYLQMKPSEEDEDGFVYFILNRVNFIASPQNETA